MPKIISTEIRKRSFFGRIFKWMFILFNMLMAMWIFSYYFHIGGMISNEKSSAAKAGAIIGTAFGSGLLLTIWAAGVAVLGSLALATRGKRVTIQEMVD